MSMVGITTESIVLDNDCRVLTYRHSMICGLSLILLMLPFISDEETLATWVVADRNTIGSSVSDEMKKCDLL